MPHTSHLCWRALIPLTVVALVGLSVHSSAPHSAAPHLRTDLSSWLENLFPAAPDAPSEETVAMAPAESGLEAPPVPSCPERKLKDAYHLNPKLNTCQQVCIGPGLKWVFTAHGGALGGNCNALGFTVYLGEGKQAGVHYFMFAPAPHLPSASDVPLASTRPAERNGTAGVDERDVAARAPARPATVSTIDPRARAAMSRGGALSLVALAALGVLALAGAHLLGKKAAAAASAGCAPGGGRCDGARVCSIAACPVSLGFKGGGPAVTPCNSSFASSSGTSSPSDGAAAGPLSPGRASRNLLAQFGSALTTRLDRGTGEGGETWMDAFDAEMSFDLRDSRIPSMMVSTMPSMAVSAAPTPASGSPKASRRFRLWGR